MNVKDGFLVVNISIKVTTAWDSCLFMIAWFCLYGYPGGLTTECRQKSKGATLKSPIFRF